MPDTTQIPVGTIEAILSTVGGQALEGDRDLDAASISRMTPGLSEVHVNGVMRVLEDKMALRKANDAVIDFMFSHEVTMLWGDGTLASSDAMNLDPERGIPGSKKAQ